MSSNASRVPGEVNSIDHFGLNIPSIQDAKSFFTAFELENPQRIDDVSVSTPTTPSGTRCATSAAGPRA